MAERAAALSEHVAAIVAPAMTDSPAPPAAASPPLQVGLPQAQPPASAAHDRLTAGISTSAADDAVSRKPAGTGFPNPRPGANTLRATLPNTLAADTGPRADSLARVAGADPAQPAPSVAQADVLRRGPEATLPVALRHPAGTASVADDDGDETATERGDSDEQEDSDEEVRRSALATQASQGQLGRSLCPRHKASLECVRAAGPAEASAEPQIGQGRPCRGARCRAD